MFTLFRRLHAWLRFRRFEADLQDELRFHHDMARERIQTRGVSPADAERMSRRALGNTTLALEDARTVWLSRLIDDFARDARHAVRLVRRQPGFSALTIATLAIGIGAVTTVVSILQAEVWRPVPFPSPDELVVVAAATTDQPDRIGSLTTQEYVAIQSQTRLLKAVGGFRWNESRVVTGDLGAERVSVAPVSTNFFDVLQVSIPLGRGFRAEEAQPGAGGVAIVSHEFWQRYVQGRADVLQQTVAVDNRPFAIVGVAPAGLQLEFTTNPHLFIPITDFVRGAVDINAIARTRPGAAPLEIDSELRPMLDPVLDSTARARGRHLRVHNLSETYRTATWRTYIVFLIAAGVLLLAACANVANLLLGRGVTRRPEFVLRAALGSSRGRLLRQLLVESVLVAGAAAIVGLGVAAFGIRAFVALAPPSYVTPGRTIGINFEVAVFAIALAALTAAICGALPARHAPHGDLREALASAGRRLGGEPGQRRLRSGLLAIEVTLAFLLLASAGILTNSFVRLNRVPLGFSPDNIWTFRVLLRGEAYRSPEQLANAHAELAARVAAIPAGVALANTTPLAGGEWRSFVLAGQAAPLATEAPRGTLHIVTHEYFRLLNIRRVTGRGLTAADRPGSPHVALVNLNLARRFFDGRDPVGQRLTLLKAGTVSAVPEGEVEIVGVVENTREVGIDEVPFDCIYLPLAQNPLPAVAVLAGVSGDTAGMLDAFRQAVRAVDPNVPMYGAITLEQRVADAYRSDRFNFLLVSGVALFAVLLAAIGVYGATAYDTARRTAEFGLRIALGATPRSILRVAIARSVGLTAIGVGCGLVIALVTARLIGDAVYLVRGQHVGIVYQVSLSDPLTLAGACTLFIGLAALAAWTPARRATQIDPMVALRE
ncbi:MAG TPA: ABC transporter permease [Vicinamibacterales bacterium]|nr:ABC transporter permease [Vicinamibacterales bacterium]